MSAIAALGAQSCESLTPAPNNRVVAASSPMPEHLDMTPAEQSPEVQALLRGTAEPDVGEPAGAIKIYLQTEEPFYLAWSRIEAVPPGSDPDAEALALLDQVLNARRRATVLYPMSRHAWQGLGEFFWRRYQWRPRRTDLGEAATAYTRAAELMVLSGNAPLRGLEFQRLATYVARGLVTLSDGPALDAFFLKLKGTALWEGARETYVVALGALNDPRADAMFRDQVGEHPEAVSSYVDYLIDRGRYAEALRLVEQTPHLMPGGDPSGRYPADYARRGALLERLGRTADAEAEYRRYFASIGQTSWTLHSLPERYRVPGSTLQAGMKFHANPGSLPAPQD